MQGTVVRVFDTRTRQLMSEFRRGSDPANLQWFDNDLNLLFPNQSYFVVFQSAIQPLLLVSLCVQ